MNRTRQPAVETNRELCFAIFGAGFWSQFQLAALRGENSAETTGEDNLKTLRLVYAAYDSAKTRKTVHLSDATI